MLAGQRRAEVEWTLDRVLARLVGADALGRLDARPAADGAEQIEVLPDVHLDAEFGEDRLRGAREVVHEKVGVDEREIADEDGDAFSEAAVLGSPAVPPVSVDELHVDGIHPPTAQRRVHDVVVDQREGMEQLQPGSCVDDVVVGGIPAGADERPMTERWPETLATGEHQVAERRKWGGEVGVDRGPADQLSVEEFPDADVDACGDLSEC